MYDKNYEIILGPGSNGLIQNICKILLKENFAKKHPSIYIMIDESNIEFSDRESLLGKELYKIDNIRKYILS